MLSLKGFSQNVTQDREVDSTKVILPVVIARLVYQDLLKYDGLKEEFKLTQFKIERLEQREIQKDSLITLLTKKDENNMFIIGKKDEQLRLSKELTDKLHKDLKKERTKTFLWKLGTFTGFVTTTLLVFGK
jgi:hypothetical protein